MSGPEWGPPLDWDAPLDGETTAEMTAELERRHIEDEIYARRAQVLWERYSGFYGRDGKLVITPSKVRTEDEVYPTPPAPPDTAGEK